MTASSPAPHPLLVVDSITKSYTKSGETVHALDNVSLSLPGDPPQIMAIAGESGSGKTTLADCVLGFTTPNSGRILYDGMDVTRLSRHDLLRFRREVQAIFQDPFGVFNPFYRVDHVFSTVLKRFNLAGNTTDAAAKIDQALLGVGLRGSEVLEKHPHQLSGGQRQRIMIARACLLNPRLIVADEPVSMVDASLRAMILDIMLRLRNDQGISFLYITHDLSTAYQIADTIAIVHKGKIVESGPVREVIDNPQDPYSQLLINSIPVPDPTIRWNSSQESTQGALLDVQQR